MSLRYWIAAKLAPPVITAIEPLIAFRMMPTFRRYNSAEDRGAVECQDIVNDPADAYLLGQLSARELTRALRLARVCRSPNLGGRDGKHTTEWRPAHAYTGAGQVRIDPHESAPRPNAVYPAEPEVG